MKNNIICIIFLLIGIFTQAQPRNNPRVDTMEAKLLYYGAVYNHIVPIHEEYHQLKADCSVVMKLQLTYLDSMIMILNPLHRYYKSSKDTSNFSRIMGIESKIVQFKNYYKMQKEHDSISN